MDKEETIREVMKIIIKQKGKWVGVSDVEEAFNDLKFELHYLLAKKDK